MNSRIHVVVGIIFDANKDKVLISKRTKKQHLGGYWEFPGGKIKSNEKPFLALKRELGEELGIDVKDAVSLVQINHDYTDRRVCLDVWVVQKYIGELVSQEGQEIKWLRKNNLYNQKFLEANKYIIKILCLPEIYGISDNYYNNFSEVFSQAKNYFSSGLKIFQLRLKLEKNNDFLEGIKQLSVEAKKSDTRLILNGKASDIDYFPVDGIHLKSKELFKYTHRPISEDYILGASCHNKSEIYHAVKLNIDYIFISPVLSTTSHPISNPIGWDNFKELSKLAKFPVYALGGLSANHLEMAKRNGAHGIAMISSLKDLFS